MNSVISEKINDFTSLNITLNIADQSFFLNSPLSFFYSITTQLGKQLFEMLLYQKSIHVSYSIHKTENDSTNDKTSVAVLKLV